MKVQLRGADLMSEEEMNKTGVVLAGHGSSLPFGKQVLEDLAEQYKKNSKYLVEIGFMNISKPSIPEAINTLAVRGVNEVIVLPIFLAHGVHTTQDIPRILGLKNDESSHKHSHHHAHGSDHNEEIEFDGQILYGEPLGADSRLVDVIKDRIESVIKDAKD